MSLVFILVFSFLLPPPPRLFFPFSFSHFHYIYKASGTPDFSLCARGDESREGASGGGEDEGKTKLG